MLREIIEEGTPTTPLLVDSKKCSNASDSSITPILVYSSFVALSGSLCYGIAVAFSSPAEKGIMEDLHLTIAEYSIFGSILTIGGMLGAIFSGKVADAIGRKRTMSLSQMFCTGGWLAITFAKHSWLLDVARLLIGFGVGFITYVVPVYIAEISPKNHRGRFTLTYMLMVCCGFALFFFIGNVLSWRILSLIGAVLCLLQVAGIFFIVESPRWLAKIGREEEFEIALQRLRGASVDISKEAADIKDTIETFQHNPEAKILDLFQMKYAYPIFIGAGLMLLQTLAGNSGVAFYLNTIFTEANVSATVGSTTLSILQIPAAILGVLLMDVTGRRTLLMASSAGSCICLFVVGLSFYLQGLHYLKEVTQILIFIGIMGYAFAFSTGMSGVPWVIMSEVLPTNVKASAGSLVTLINWFGSWIVTYTFNFMMQWSSAGTFFIFAGMCALTFLFTWKFVPETKGRTLEEIQVGLVSHHFSKEDC